MDTTTSDGNQRTPLAISKIASALGLASKGFRVMPVTMNQKKPPLLDGWQKSATSDCKQIEEVWGYEPRLNIGCLIDSGFSIDFDTKKGGLDSMRRMEEAGLLPQTYTQRSATGGFHKTYRCPIEIAMALKNAAGHIPGYPGTDIRASRKGYIVGAGSTTGDGVYTIVDDAAIAHASTALLDLLPKEEPNRGVKFEPPAADADSAQEIARAKDYLQKRAPEAIEGQHGDDTTGFTTIISVRRRLSGCSRTGTRPKPIRRGNKPSSSKSLGARGSPERLQLGANRQASNSDLSTAQRTYEQTRRRRRQANGTSRRTFGKRRSRPRTRSRALSTRS
jgi:hypothetical protein